MPKTILIAAFEGWNDASQAATNVVRHLVSRYESQEVRHIDNEGFYDYQVARPMICSVQGRKRIIWPQTTFYDIAVSPMLHLLAQIAPEPNYRWEEYCRQTLRVAEDYDVSDVITLGSMNARTHGHCRLTSPKAAANANPTGNTTVRWASPTSLTPSPPKRAFRQHPYGYPYRITVPIPNACKALWSCCAPCL